MKKYFHFFQRSSSVPESQLSPSYGSQLLNNSGAQISPGGQRLNQQPYSPHSQLASPQQSFSNFPSTGGGGGGGGGSGGGGSQTRLSPHPPSSFQQSQLSPRISQVIYMSILLMHLKNIFVYSKNLNIYINNVIGSTIGVPDCISDANAAATNRGLVSTKCKST